MFDRACQIALLADRPGVGIAKLEGPIDVKSVAGLRSALVSTRARRIILDLQDCRYINSAGMSYLVQLADALEAVGGGLFLANPQPKVRVVLEMMGLTAFLKLHSTVQAALRAAGFREPARPLRRGSPA